MHYVFRLLPPRPSFPADMTPEEAALMQAHMSYWGEMMQRGRVVLIGPVAGDAGVYGLCVFEAEDDASAEATVAADPVLSADAGFGREVHRMIRCQTRPIH
jgi:uncharacterized protein YciI